MKKEKLNKIVEDITPKIIEIMKAEDERLAKMTKKERAVEEALRRRFNRIRGWK